MVNDINKGQSADINLERKRGKAIFFSILGAINVSILSIFSFYPYNYPFGEIAQGLSTKLMLRILLITILVALIGLILGIMSLKTSKKKICDSRNSIRDYWAVELDLLVYGGSHKLNLII